MATYTKYNKFIEHFANKIIDYFGTNDTYMLALASDAPDTALDETVADITQVSNGNGYTTGGADMQNDSTRTGGTVTETSVDITWTASGGTIGPFRYAVGYDDTPTSPADPLMRYWDYGSNVTLQVGETFTADFGASTATLS